MYDLIVIGAGPGGYEAAAHAGQLGRRVLLIERQYLGGTCLNVGCIPTKTLLRSSRLFAEMKEAARFGVTAGEVRFDLRAVLDRKNRVVATLTRGAPSSIARTAWWRR